MQNVSSNPRTYTQIHTARMVQGRGKGWGLMEPLPRVFDVLQYCSKQFCLQDEAILFLVALLENWDVTNNGLHLGFTTN